MKMSNQTEKNVYDIGQKIGIEKNDIKNMFQKQKKKIITGAIIVVALAFASNIYYLGTHYGGISLEDFLSNFRFLRFLFGRF
jgi:hypothetical protein